MTRQLTAHATRDDDGTWTITIPELTSAAPSGATIVATGSALTFRGVKKAASDLAAVWLDVEPSELEVTVTVEAPSAIVQLVTESNDANAAGKAAIERADTLRREAARKLREEGYPMEAAGAILGVSYQRVQQLAGPSNRLVKKSA